MLPILKEPHQAMHLGYFMNKKNDAEAAGNFIIHLSALTMSGCKAISALALNKSDLNKFNN